MATLLDIQQSGSTIINLNSSPFFLLDFTSNTPEERSEEFASVYQHGESVLYVRYRNVKETVDLIVSGATRSAVDTTIQNLEDILSDALRLLETVGDKVYIRYKPDGTTITWRAEVLTGRVIPSPLRSHENAMQLVGSGAAGKYFRHIQVELTRKPVWNDDALTELSLSNTHGSGTGGRQVDNHNDVSEDSFVNIASTPDVAQHSPVRLEITNPGAASTRIDKMHVARNGRFTPAGTDLQLEAESMAYFGQGGTTTPVAGYSNGNVVQWTPTLVAGTEYLYGYWTLTGSFMQNLRGRWFRVILAVDNVNANLSVKTKLTLLGLTTLQETPLLNLRYSGMHDLGLMRFPPFDLGSETPHDLRLQLHAMNPSTTGGNLSVDFVLLMPTEPDDGYTLLQAQGYSLLEGSTLILDGIEEKITVLNPGLGATSHFIGSGHWPFVTSQVAQRFWFAWNDPTGGLMEADYITVRAYYRKSRLNV
jgi:hypothetical protein